MSSGSGTAGVDGGARRGAGQGSGEIGQAIGVLGDHVDPVSAEIQKLVGEGHGGAGASAVDQAPFVSGRGHSADHGQEGGHADTARDEEVVVCQDERELVARAPDGDPPALAQAVDLCGTAAAVRHAQDTDAVRLPVGRVPAQRVRADQAGGQHQLDVGTGLPPW